MLKLETLKPKIKKPKKIRRGRGASSGKGGYSGRGIKGQKARAGGGIRPGFEGGRMPIIRQMPKVRGFKSHRAKAQVVDIADIVKVFSDGAEVSPVTLHAKGLVRSTMGAIKILGKNQAAKRFIFKDVKFSEAAKQALEKK